MRWSKQPKVDRKTGNQVGYRYEFWSYDPNKRRYDRVPVSELPANGIDFKTDDDAQAYCDLKSAEEDAVMLRIKKRLEWQQRYNNFPKLIEDFTAAQRVKAPNSWETDIFHLERYILPFFLTERKCNNIQNWPLYYNEFRQWVSETKPFKWNKDRLAVNTQNRIIKAMNRFIEWNSQRLGVLLLKCPVFDRDLQNKVTAKDVPDEDEIQIIQSLLKEIRYESYQLYTVIVRTGLRLNEALGLCTGFVIDGQLDGAKSKKIHNALIKYGLKDYFGYICLESQPALEPCRAVQPFTDRFKQKWSVGSVPRKPLKCRKKIDPAFFRHIPIFDKTAWNEIVDLFESKEVEFKAKKYGDDERDYLLFDGITASMFYRDLQKAYEIARMRFKSPHKLRHAYLTWFYDVTNDDDFLSEAVGGHRDKRSRENYSHIAEQIGRERKIASRRIRRLPRA